MTKRKSGIEIRIGVVAVMIAVVAMVAISQRVHTPLTELIFPPTPTPSPTITPTPSPSPTLTPSPSPTPRPTRPPQPTINWSAGRPLVWSDFKGPPETGTDKVAETYSGINVNWTYHFDCTLGGGRYSCNASATNFVIYALFDTRKSWVKPGFTTPEVLDHEQLHFDIAELHARRMKSDVQQFAGQTTSGEGPSQVEAQNNAEAGLSGRVNAVLDARYASEDAEQNAYDAVAGHGEQGPQKEWDQKIRSQL